MQIFFLNFTRRHLIKFRDTALKCSKNLKATQDFNQSSKTHIINKPISFEHIQVPRAKEIDQLSGNVIGRLSVKPWCYWLWRLGMSLVPFNASTARLLFCYANTWLHRCLVTQLEDAILDYAKAALFVWADAKNSEQELNFKLFLQLSVRAKISYGSIIVMEVPAQIF